MGGGVFSACFSFIFLMFSHLQFVNHFDLQQEWSDSIEQAHPAGVETDQLVAQHWKNVDRIAKSFRSLLPALDEGLEQLLDARQSAADSKICVVKRHCVGATSGSLKSSHPSSSSDSPCIGGGLLNWCARTDGCHERLCCERRRRSVRTCKWHVGPLLRVISY